MHSSSLVKKLLRPFIPCFLLRWRGSRVQRIRDACSRRLYMFTGGRVLSGPFAGMRYLEASVGSTLGPKLLGTYESELHPIVQEIIAYVPDTIVDVGAAEGYYAVGLLTRLVNARITAFETDESGQSLIRVLGEANSVLQRLAIRGTCGTCDLSEVLKGRKIVLIVDVEGMEEQLLDPDARPALRTASILVEVHEHIRPGVSETLRRWYATSHEIRTIATIAGGLTPLPRVVGLTKSELRLLADEMRPSMHWFWMVPRQVETEAVR